MRLFSLLAAAALVFAVGCTGKKTVQEGEEGKKVDIARSFLETNIKPGETAKVEVSITREKYDGPVDVKFMDLPEDVKVEGGETQKLDKGVTKKEFTLKADKDAKPGKKTAKVEVSATEDPKAKATKELVIEVEEKK
jgi:protein-disulfide isomerase